ncbi:uncharacterized protein LOC116336775 [Contarinia nasturtii]|uniref:uncharacterized protein LOC116336775 n=1 Tax=Contarinia nasturtii TaxID=265458 RepID=UPI0012D47B17|nr:uncharacterized protein LOC116336775 [Contarinia nasturtii]
MKRVVEILVIFLAIVSAPAAASASIEPHEKSIKSQALNYGLNRNSSVTKVQCVTDTIDSIVTENHVQGIWQNVQRKLHNNIGNIFACLKLNGFSAQGCIAKEAIGIGLSMNGFLGKLDWETPEAGKQLRIHLVRNCANSQQ